MGKLYSIFYNKNNIPDHIPRHGSEPTFDPHLGFEAKRVQRKIGVTENQLRAFKINRKNWDYCSKLLIDAYACQKHSYPFINMFCRKKIGLYKHCTEEDYILRMKEYEREKRLRARQKKLEGKSIN